MKSWIPKSCVAPGCSKPLVAYDLPMCRDHWHSLGQGIRTWYVEAQRSTRELVPELLEKGGHVELVDYDPPRGMRKCSWCSTSSKFFHDFSGIVVCHDCALRDHDVEWFCFCVSCAIGQCSECEKRIIYCPHAEALRCTDCAA